MEERAKKKVEKDRKKVCGEKNEVVEGMEGRVEDV